MSGTPNGGQQAASTEAAFAQADLDKARIEGHAAGREEGMKAGADAERARVSGILAHEEAKGRTDLAVQCINTGLTVEQAGAILGAAPKTAAAAGNGFAAAMGAIGNPDVSGIEGKTEGEGDAAVAGQILQAFRGAAAAH